ncbi:DUF2378 family protein [Hyalangium sp.]|uniref:DUF2378 family protein n=1 Tax=Hyalangium sp. TaxID=2028555 RepID=UPI002D6673ED|nr:DUF2378 family protein [Hyalangium sp.]HYI01258.1 DUF2378 family protein [Hyalangium sp.]
MTHFNAASASPVGGVELDYERRIALAKPHDTTRGLFFNGVLAAVIALGGESALKQCHVQLNDKRFEKRFIDFSNYPVSDFLRLALAATRVLSPQLGGPEATQRKLGMQAMRDFLNSMAGRTLLLLSGDSPKRVMGHLASGYRSVASYGERTVTMQGDNGARVVMKGDYMLPLYTEGVLQAMLEAVHAKNPQVRARPFGQLDCEYDLSWG